MPPTLFCGDSKGQKRSPRWQRWAPWALGSRAAQDSVSRPRDGKSAPSCASGKPQTDVTSRKSCWNFQCSCSPFRQRGFRRSPPCTPASRLRVYLREHFSGVQVSHLGPGSHLLWACPMHRRVFRSIRWPVRPRSQEQPTPLPRHPELSPEAAGCPQRGGDACRGETLMGTHLDVHCVLTVTGNPPSGRQSGTS